jgi:hypothetical protein
MGVFLESGRIVIDDAYVCSFAERNGAFLELCGSVLRAVCDVFWLAESTAGAGAESPEAPTAPLVPSVPEAQMAQFVEEVRSVVAQAQSAQSVQLAQLVQSAHAAQAAQSAQAVQAVQSVNAANAANSAAAALAAAVLGRLTAMGEEREATQKMIERVCATLEEKERSNRRKGDDGEIGLVQVLEGVLTVRDGFTIERVGTIAHNCDILIRKQGKPDVRVECKAHGKDNGKPVAAREVVRFEDDLKLLRNHGIFVSLYAPITGKAQFELRLLESNRVAVYLSNNNFDAAMIRDLVLLIYQVDALIHAEGIVIGPERLCRIKAGLRDVSIKAAQIQAHLRAGLELVGSMCIDSVTRMLAEAGEGSATEAPGPVGPGLRSSEPSGASYDTETPLAPLATLGPSATLEPSAPLPRAHAPSKRGRKKN